jgi:hypothetical protein
VTTEIRTPPHHNTTTCYTDYRCRLPECVARYNNINRERIRARKAGTYNRFIDAEPVRRHILRLQRAGMGTDAIAAAASINKQSILEFLRPLPTQGRGRRQRTTAATAAKIMAVTVEDQTLGRIDATATLRRVQALVALGWPINHIARHAGLFDENAASILNRRFVYVSTAKAIEAAYEELRTKRPSRNGVSRPHAQAARNRAARNRWAPPSYWDDPEHPIGDATFESRYGITSAQVMAEEARWLMKISGLTQEQAAQRLNRSHSYIKNALHDYPETSEQVAA